MSKKKEAEVQEPTGNEMVKQDSNTMIFGGNEYSVDEMAEIFGNTGLDDIPPEKRRMPLIAWNLDFRDDMGNDVRPDKFYNCQTGDMTDEMEVALIFIKQTLARVYRDKESGTKTLLCASFDCKHGEPTPTEQYPNPAPVDCEGCIHRKSKKGTAKACTIIDRVVVFDLKKNEFVLMNIARTSFVPFNNYLERNFFGKIKDPRTGKRSDLPIYMMRTKITLKEEEGNIGRYYVLQLENLGVLPKTIVMDLLPMVQSTKNLRRQEIMVETTDNKPKEGAKQEVINGEVVDDSDVPF